MQQPRRILYIDDDAGIRRLVEKNLGRRGHDVVTADSGADGIAKTGEGGFEIIAVDHYMPGLDGLATLQQLRDIPACPPVVYVTGSEESAVAVAALKAGAADYIVKSVGEDFVDLLEQAFTNALAQERLVRAKEEAEQDLRTANERLAALLREVNHRVANSLQLVTTMVTMQSRMLSDPSAKAALADTERRIQAIGSVHRKLYTSGDVESVAMDEYLAAMVTELEETWSTPTSPRPIKLAAEPVLVPTDKAVSLGVIVNELVINSCKYAYAEGEPGEIRVQFGKAGEREFQLTVEDDGRGFCANSSPQGTGLGSKLISAMAKSLSSRLEYDESHAGCRALVVATI